MVQVSPFLTQSRPRFQVRDLMLVRVTTQSPTLARFPSRSTTAWSGSSWTWPAVIRSARARALSAVTSALVAAIRMEVWPVRMSVVQAS